MSQSTFSAVDDLVGPVVTQLAAVAQQVAGVGECYLQPPEGPPVDNSVIFPLKNWKSMRAGGKQRMTLTFEVVHLFRRTRLQDAIQRAYTFIHPWELALSRWTNINLAGTAVAMNPIGGEIREYLWGNTPYTALVHEVEVVVEFPVVTN